VTRSPEGREPRTITVHVRFTPSGASALDIARGPLKRSDYIRRLVANDVNTRRLGEPLREKR